MSAFVTSFTLLYVSSSIHVFLLLFLYVSLRQHILLYISDACCLYYTRFFLLFIAAFLLGNTKTLLITSVGHTVINHQQYRSCLLSLCSSLLRTVLLVSLCSSQWRCSWYPCALLSGGAPGILAGTYCCQCVHLGRPAPPTFA